MKSIDYQNEVFQLLQNIFGKDLVFKEWDSVKYDGHTSNHKLVYAPRLDIAVGPFNSLANLDIGSDKAEIMRKHPLTKILCKEFLNDREDLGNIWNKFNRCYLAIEIEFNSNSKHALGSLINASVSGALGVIIVETFKKKKELERLENYVKRLEGLELIELNSLRNVIIFEKNEFMEFLLNLLKTSKYK